MSSRSAARSPGVKPRTSESIPALAPRSTASRDTPMRRYSPARFGLPPTTPIDPVSVPASAKTASAADAR